MYIYLYIYMYIYIYIYMFVLLMSTGARGGGNRDSEQCKTATILVWGKELFLLREPLPCNTSAETALQPLIWSTRGTRR